MDADDDDDVFLSDNEDAAGALIECLSSPAKGRSDAKSAKNAHSAYLKRQRISFKSLAGSH